MNSNVRKLVFGLCLLVLARWLVSWLVGDDADEIDNQLQYTNLNKDLKLFSGCNSQNNWCKSDRKKDKGSSPVPGSGLVPTSSGFLLDGQPFRILSGSFHYFRTQPAQWEDRILKMKAAGLNTVMTYIPWNLHERTPMNYEFGGRWDIVNFIRLIHKHGLKAIIRPGPYICSEWDFGGMPYWLLNDPKMKVRDFKYKPFLNFVERYFAKLLPLFVPHQYTKGTGPIIAFQIENEYGSFSQDLPYLRWVKSMYEKYGLEEMFFTSDGPDLLANGTIPGVYATVNFMHNVDKAFDSLAQFQPGKPLMVTEYWSGWFDHWGDEFHHTTRESELVETISQVLRRNGSINFYMFVGGTNFEFWNGANNQSSVGHYEPTITSYDYDAPISESGDITAKYMATQTVLKAFNLVQEPLPPIPLKVIKMYYGKVKMTETLAYENVIVLSDKTSSLSQPRAMELLDINNHGGQGYGYILYRTEIAPDAARVQFYGNIFDRGIILQDSTPVTVFDWNNPISNNGINVTEIKVITQPFRSMVDIFVENMGRVNYKFHLNEQRKGFLGRITVNGHVHKGHWLHVSLEFDKPFIDRMSSSSKWMQYMYQTNPCGYRGYLTIQDEPRDTFISMAGWDKGLVIINGYNIGRYWSIGPQETLYVPASLLQTGKNEVIIFELSKPGEFVRFVDEPNLGHVNN